MARVILRLGQALSGNQSDPLRQVVENKGYTLCQSQKVKTFINERDIPGAGCGVTEPREELEKP